MSPVRRVVLNGAKSGTRTSAETRARVVAAAERLHYRANATARALANGRANAIGIVAGHWKEDANLYFMEVFGGIIEVAAATQQTTAVFMLRDWDEARRRIPAFCDGRIDGLVLVAPCLRADASDWMPKHIPSVSLHSDCAIAGVVNLEPDEEVGSFVAVSHMLAIGHRRILHIGGPAGMLGMERRLGVTVVPDWLRRHAGDPLPGAVFCCNDTIAVGCIHALTMQGLRVPEDVSVVGFDDTWIARAAGLTTVRQPLHTLGRRAMEVLIEQIEARREGGRWQGSDNIVLPTELVQRTTLAAPRRRRRRAT
jgi:DNA-binding LacI/PurR family transcriptional regulator